MPASAVTAPGTSAATVTATDAAQTLPDDGHCSNRAGAVIGKYCASCGQLLML